MGWIVEIAPFDPTSMPAKRTALCRFKDENAACAQGADGRVVVYMGDDEANDYIYKFVSDGRFDPGRSAANRELLDHGKLCVARFSDTAAAGRFMGTGEWILLDKAANPLAFSRWPEASGGRPRSATVVVTKDDGGVIGT